MKFSSGSTLQTCIFGVPDPTPPLWNSDINYYDYIVCFRPAIDVQSCRNSDHGFKVTTDQKTIYLVKKHKKLLIQNGIYDNRPIRELGASVSRQWISGTHITYLGTLIVADAIETN